MRWENRVPEPKVKRTAYGHGESAHLDSSLDVTVRRKEWVTEAWGRRNRLELFRARSPHSQ